MSSERPNQTVADYVALVVSPALIMGLIASLAFFLIEIFYRADGEWKGRLQYILFFFIFGAVLVARISMTGEIAARAKFYGPVLALVTYLGLQTFVEYPEGSGLKELSFFVNMLLVGVVWWCAHRITWDCTNIDEETDVNSEGLLHAAGLEEAQQPGADKDAAEESDKPEEKKLGWVARWQRYRDARNKKRTLGVWVVYFSMAALPIFGLGQSLIPLTSPGRRQFAFWLMTVYVACGLGLLMTTCFLGLRRYLRQRRLQMPAAMTGTWLTVGGGLIAVLLLMGALLPRPYAEYPLLDVFRTSSAKRKASEYAMKGGPTGEGKGRPGEMKHDPKGRPVQGKEPGKGGEGKGEEGKGEPGKGEPGKGETGKGEEAKGEEAKGEPGKGEKGEKSGGKEGDKAEQGDGAKGPKDAENKSGESKSGGSSSRDRQALQRVSQVLGKVAPVLKWIVFGVLALAFAFFVLRGGLGFLANFTDWAKRLLEAWRNFWANLFGGKEEKAGEARGGEEEGEARARQVPFADFPNPFDSGAAKGMKAQELVRYTFAALEAWARERGLGRQTGETAQEFAGRVGGEAPALEEDVRRLETLYATAAYSRGAMPCNTAEVVRQFWERLERVAEQPLSA